MTCLAVKNEGETILEITKNRGWQYLLLAFVDVEANYLIVKAYQYTSVTSVQVSFQIVHKFTAAIYSNLSVK